MSLNKRILELENKVIFLESKLMDLSKNTEETYQPPISIVGGGRDRGQINPVDIKAGMGQIQGGSIIWNTSELGNPPANTEPAVPNENTGKGYNKHSHSHFSGGALIKDVLEIVEYDFVETPIVNKHSQQFWVTQPNIKKEINTNGEAVDKIGILDLVFNPDTQTWGTPAYEIDIKKCFLVERVTVVDGDNPTIGAIKVDSKGHEMKSPLYNEDTTKTSIVWDENAQVFRFYAVFAPGAGV
jgi:hypothetical protein